ncbi:signal peptidase II [Pengzhenrongella frigida]|uniref:Lipoprotein signal peptidase n=1 Tax=Pengzhenrongella frigida TaxID=1259133 RepID=A0A4Q5N2T4_9MICO|nr:signal peptidase II [Cellulomonas sp. HLT2-17]RYV52498.1 signal peptidase II [Cellulomonas sp. HLT2-17]
MSHTPDVSPLPEPLAGLSVDPPGGSGSPSVAPRRRRQLLILLTALAVGVLAVDQVTKIWAEGTLVIGERTPLVGDLLGLSLIHNPGAALSIATGMTWVLTLVATAVVVVVVRASRRIGSMTWAIAFGLLLGGALGNLADRFLREPGFARGHVVDFIAYGNVFVGNVADIAIVAAAGLIIVASLRGIGLDGSRETRAQPDQEPTEAESERG